MKVHILTTCPACKGQAYLLVGEEIDNNGTKYLRYIPCSRCQGSGQSPQWVTFQEFLTLLHQAQCPHQHTSLHGTVHFSASDVWDDIEEVCDECGANLDKLILG